MDEVLELAREVSDYTICGEGNVSVRDGNNFKVKASGTSLHTLEECDLTLCDINGKQLDESHKKPSIEVFFHAWIMRQFPQINFISHTPPHHKTKILCSKSIHEFACNRWFPDQIVRNGTKSCVVPYAPPGEAALGMVEKSVIEFVNREGFFPKLILLQNHGIITASASKKDCAAATLMCEKSAEIFVGAKLLGGIKYLSNQEVLDVDKCPNENYRRNMYQ